MAEKILIVEDELKIAQLLSDYVSTEGYESQIVAEGNKAIKAFNDFQPNVILLDVMLPGMNGIDICKNIRKTSNVGIIIISAKTEEIDRLIGLEIGADDYICKPFSPKEVIVRIRSLLRRLNQSTTKSQSECIIQLDESSYSVKVKNQTIQTTSTEFRLLAILLKQPGRIYSRSQLVDKLHEHFSDISDRAIDSHIKNVRKKIKNIAPETEIIKSVYGVGYKAELE